jgi:hypothetical protein
MSTTISGGCACGAIRYKSSASRIAMANCHCTDCQRAAGAPFTSVVLVPKPALEVQGEPRWFEAKADNGNQVRRAFCPTCGTPLFSESSGSDGALAVLKAGSLDDAS